MLHGFLRWCLVFACWIALAAAILYVGFWRSYRADIVGAVDLSAAQERLAPIRHVSPSTMRLLGSIRQSKVSSFIHFDQAKPQGGVRICALGDSLTQGDELGDEHDYPSHLQRLFDRAGVDNVQVLNFGNGWYGFSQIYVMWKHVASRFGCDFVLLVPAEFWRMRDTTFNHTRGRNPDYLHARLVVEDDELRLVEPLGETAEQRVNGYHRAIPQHRYLHYDAHPPNVFDAILPGKRRLPNPFYYTSTTKRAEVMDIYKRIIRVIAQSGAQVVVGLLGTRESMYPQIIPEHPRNISVTLLDDLRIQGFPYRAPAGHPSSWGQEAVAWAFKNVLSPGGNHDFATVGVRSLEDSSASHPEALYDFARVWIAVGDQRTGYFVEVRNRLQDAHEQHVRLLQREGIAALLFLAGRSGNAASACFLPLGFVPEHGKQLAVVSASGEEITLGDVIQWQPGVAIFRSTSAQAKGQLCDEVSLAGVESPPSQQRELFLDGKLIAAVGKDGIVPTHGEMLALRDSGEYLADVRAFTSARVLEIVLERPNGTRVRRPLLSMEAGVPRTTFRVQTPPVSAVDQSGAVVPSI